ncbi:MAG: hypothetical protein H6887_13490 [Hoeflea sp.]|nr:hypothetical protein [Hoeflea sp.]
MSDIDPNAITASNGSPKYRSVGNETSNMLPPAEAHAGHAQGAHRLQIALRRVYGSETKRPLTQSPVTERTASDLIGRRFLPS